jgi:anti-anti-sigma factor
MNLDDAKASSRMLLRIDGELTIFRAAELKPLLLSDPLPSAIDLSGVTELDTAGVQLLMLAKNTAQAQQRELRLVGHSQAVQEVLALLNLSSGLSTGLGDGVAVGRGYES